MSEPQVPIGVVLVVDDEALMRSALQRLFQRERLQACGFASGAELLESPLLQSAACLILDVRMPGMSGLEVQAELKRRGIGLPTIFLTGMADVPLAVAAMREGAIDFIEKPFDDAHLLERVRHAMQQGQRHRGRQAHREEVLGRLATLTPRERDVLALVVKGTTNKEIGRLLGTSHRTVDIHRGRVMEKMETESLAALVYDVLLANDSSIGT
ncbi:MAG: response regulator [Tahibacter sp.]